MLATTSAYAALRADSRQVTGASTLQAGLNLDYIADVYRASSVKVTNNQYEVSALTPVLESGWVADFEAAYDIALLQAATYIRSVLVPKNPAWNAVTGYYASFFAARALLYGIGVGHRNFGNYGALNKGLYQVTLQPSSTSLNESVLICRTLGGGGSHQKTWRALRDLLARLLGVGALDARALAVLPAMDDLVAQPVSVSTYRNSVNYSLDIALEPVLAWASELKRVKDSADLEIAIAAGNPSRDEHRLELLLLANLSWLRLLYDDYMDRADRPDRRRAHARAKSIKKEDAAVADILNRWFRV